MQPGSFSCLQFLSSNRPADCLGICMDSFAGAIKNGPAQLEFYLVTFILFTVIEVAAVYVHLERNLFIVCTGLKVIDDQVYVDTRKRQRLGHGLKQSLLRRLRQVFLTNFFQIGRKVALLRSNNIFGMALDADGDPAKFLVVLVVRWVIG